MAENKNAQQVREITDKLEQGIKELFESEQFKEMCIRDSLSEDDAMLGAEAQYCRMEQELQRYLDTYESTHSYDEYHFDLDDIEHDPYVLISILSALHVVLFDQCDSLLFSLNGIDGKIV